MGFFGLILFVISFLYPIGPGFFPFGYIIYPAMILILAAVSKKIFQRSFANLYWKVLFVASLVFSVIAIGLAYLGISDVLSVILNRYIEADERMGYSILSMFFNVIPFIFFISYLVNFIVRLVRRGKVKKHADASRD